ncbi:unnamed protein product [Cuscuta europaea]|uniref:Glabrous enhancer-binding protein-like DBD domain-containing protein n=1 Tax=Cuscuta europaea TaxID=41803 RepID=A0A9P1E7R6_CUSEU|nr:unnamed protein product [Cuscuta europaea]
MAPKSRLTLLVQPTSADPNKKIHQSEPLASQGEKNPGKRKRAPPGFKKKSPEASDEPNLTPKLPGSPKRALHAVGEEEPRKKKKNISGEADVPSEQKKSAPHNRVWNDDDQVAILQGMIDFKAQRGTDPSADYAAFKDFVMDKLHGSFSKTQIGAKIRGLHRKFLTLSKKGDLPTSAQPYECQVYELLAKIWGTASSINAKSPGVASDFAKPEAKFASGEVNQVSNSKKTTETTNIMDAPKAASDKKTTAHDHKEKKKKKRKKRKTHPEEEVEKTTGEKNHEQISIAEKDKQTAANGKGNPTASPKGNDNHSGSNAKANQTAADGKDNRYSASKEKNSQPAPAPSAKGNKHNHSASEGKNSQPSANENLNQASLKNVMNGEAKNETGDFQSKYPCLVRSFNKENYSFSTQETIDMLKEKVNLIERTQAVEIEEKWVKLREEHAAHCVKVADLVALQARFLFDAAL